MWPSCYINRKPVINLAGLPKSLDFSDKVNLVHIHTRTHTRRVTQLDV